ncbi:MAG TPA: hypothetical protein VMR37_04035 [Rhabdochlamydiaceae bacterium]|nr:hypothetical protein [Rhabdochlamydiaceae bacterium]
MDLELTLTLTAVSLAISIPLTIKIAPSIKQIFFKTKNGSGYTQNIAIEAEAGASPVTAIGSGNAAGRDQFNNCIIGSVSSPTDKESAAAAIKQAIYHFFYSMHGFLDPRNSRSGRIKLEMLNGTLDTFRRIRKALQVVRKTYAPKLEDADQVTLKNLFNNLVGKDEKEMNKVTEDAIHATLKNEKDFIEASGKILDKYI